MFDLACFFLSSLSSLIKTCTSTYPLINFVLMFAQIPSTAFPTVDLLSTSEEYRRLLEEEGKEEVGRWERERWERERWEGREKRVEEHSDIVLLVFWQVSQRKKVCI